jgi:hypothetical protein
MRNLLLICLFLPISSFAQVSESDTLRVQSRLTLTGNWQTGNVDLLAIRAKAELAFVPSPNFAFKTQNAYLYQEFFRRKADEDIFSRNYCYYRPWGKFYPFALAFVSTNFRRQIELRYFAGAGLSWRVHKRPRHLVKLALSGVYEQTQFANPAFNLEAYNGRNAIATWRATFWLFGRHLLFNRKLIFHYESYAQPSLENWDNLRWQIETGLDVPIWQGLNFTTNFVYTFESVVAINLKRYDQLLSFGLAYQFKK